MSTITTRAGKGSPLTNAEVDDNFTNLDTDKLESIENESLSDLSNVRTTLPTNGQVLAFNASFGSWEPQDASGGAAEINDLTDGFSNGAIYQSLCLGENAGAGLNSNTTYTTCVGYNAGLNTTANANTLIGANAGDALTTGFSNTAVGSGALGAVTTGWHNVGIGVGALYGLTGSARLNIGIGNSAGYNLTSGINNINIGDQSTASSASINHEITLGNDSHLYFRIPGLQATASNGDVLTHNATTGRIELTAPSGGGGGSGDMTWQTAWPSDPASGNIPIGNNTLTTIQNSGYRNVAIGDSAARLQQYGDDGVAIGYLAGETNVSSANVFVGAYAGRYLDSGSYNVGVGYYALNRNSSNANYNVGIGYASGNVIETADYTVIMGYNANPIDGADTACVGIGGYAKPGFYSVNIGYQSGYSSTLGSDYNTCVGYQTGYDLDGGDYNCFIGYQAGYAGGSGAGNVGVGRSSMRNLNGGTKNVGAGENAGYYITNGSQNTVIGADAGASGITLQSGTNNILLGYQASPTSSSITNEITLGNSSITSLRCNVTSISSLSDERDKTNIVDIPYGLDFINDMRPVKFDWDRRDGSFIGEKSVGFIAQDLHSLEIEYGSQHYTNLVDVSNPERYEARPMEAFPIMVKAIQELSAKVEALEAEVAILKGE